jgi:hypothetical protein
MAPWRRAGQWSLRLPCAAPRRHAVWGRLSSEGLGFTCSQVALSRNLLNGDAMAAPVCDAKPLFSASALAQNA